MADIDHHKQFIEIIRDSVWSRVKFKRTLLLLEIVLLKGCSCSSANSCVTCRCSCVKTNSKCGPGCKCKNCGNIGNVLSGSDEPQASELEVVDT